MAIKKVITKDKSITFYNDDFDETYHSKSGALEEAFEKHAKPCNLSKINKQKINLLDFCFGLGYNSLAGLHELMKNKYVKEIHIVGIENDKKIIKKIKELHIDVKEFILFKELIDKKNTIKKYHNKKIKFELIMEDATKAITELKNNFFDVCFFDPFSPKKCPELWTENIFKDIYSVMKKNSVLTTYSCARVVKDNLKKSGFNRFNGPKVGRKAPSTIAIK